MALKHYRPMNRSWFGAMKHGDSEPAMVETATRGAAAQLGHGRRLEVSAAEDGYGSATVEMEKLWWRGGSVDAAEENPGGLRSSGGGFSGAVTAT